MILNKKGFMMLPLAALLFATGCAKQISYDDAVKFAKDNYTSTEQKTPKKIVYDVVCTANNDDARNIIKKMFPDLDENLKYHKDITEELYPMSVLSGETLEAYKDDMGDALVFTVSGKQMTISAEMKETVGNVENLEKISMSFNDSGYLAKNEMFGSYKDSEINYSMKQTQVYEY